jgi:hypothetical protein
MWDLTTTEIEMLWVVFVYKFQVCILYTLDDGSIDVKQVVWFQ